jgi:hypothetical protein
VALAAPDSPELSDPSDLLFYFEACDIDAAPLSADDAPRILAALRGLLELPPDAQTPDGLLRLLRPLYGRNVPDDYVALVRDKVVELLRVVRDSALAVPRLLLDAAAALFGRPGAVRMELRPPETVFDRGDLTVDEDLKALEWELTFGHVPFRRFRKARRPPAVARQSAVVPNIKTVMAVLRFLTMEAPQFEAQRRELIQFLKNFENDRFILLVTGMGMKLKGVYRLDGDGDAVKIWGAGPGRIGDADVDKYLKYVSAAKELQAIPTKHFTQTTDACSLKRAVEPRHW